MFEDIAGGREPSFQRYIENGEVRYLHETGYGYLPASRVQIVANPSLKNTRQESWNNLQLDGS